MAIIRNVILSIHAIRREYFLSRAPSLFMAILITELTTELTVNTIVATMIMVTKKSAIVGILFAVSGFIELMIGVNVKRNAKILRVIATLMASCSNVVPKINMAPRR